MTSSRHTPYSRILAVAAVILALQCGSAQAGSRYLIRQSTVTDCGPAALATLLNYYLGVPASEAEMMRVTGSNQKIGSTLLGLERAANAEGCEANSYRMSFDKLKEQMRTYPIPVIVRTLLPEPHFSLVLAIDKDYVYLGDPANGNIVMRHRDFLRRWYIPTAPVTREGYVFVAAAPDGKWQQEHVREVLAGLAQELRTLQSSRPPIAFVRH